MRVIIAGSRTLSDPMEVFKAVHEAQFPITVILTGGCQGVDKMVEDLAKGGGVPCEVYPADWKQYGKAAGPIRNGEMVAKAEALIAVRDLGSESFGTLDIIHQARTAGLPVYVHEVPAKDDGLPF
jgi:hypothetical protein